MGHDSEKFRLTLFMMNQRRDMRLREEGGENDSDRCADIEGKSGLLLSGSMPCGSMILLSESRAAYSANMYV